MNAYRHSYEIVKNKPEAYREMAEAARLKMKDYSALSTVKKQLQKFLDVK